MATEFNEFTIKVGTDWMECLEFFADESMTTPIDKTGYTYEFIAKKTKKSSTRIIDLSTATTGMTLDGVNGKLNVALTLAETSLPAFVKCVGKVQYEIYETNVLLERQKIFSGTLTIEGAL